MTAENAIAFPFIYFKSLMRLHAWDSQVKRLYIVSFLVLSLIVEKVELNILCYEFKWKGPLSFRDYF